MPQGLNLESTTDGGGGGEWPLHRNEVCPAMWYISRRHQHYIHTTSLFHTHLGLKTNAIPGRVYSTLRCYENEHLLVVSLCILGFHMEPAVTQGRAVIALYANRQTDRQTGCKLKQKKRDMVKFEGQWTFLNEPWKKRQNTALNEWNESLRPKLKM
jgi:hypothetical protein